MSPQPAAPNPFLPFNFLVTFEETPLSGAGGGPIALASGAFSEVSGLEATMEPKVIKEGGLNYGVRQRVGPVTFGTVVLKRGVTRGAHLWKWFSLVAKGGYAHRLRVTIVMQDQAGRAVVTWQLTRALPVKFKAADLNARSTEVAIEELHLVHEGIDIAPGEPSA